MRFFVPTAFTEPPGQAVLTSTSYFTLLALQKLCSTFTSCFNVKLITRNRPDVLPDNANPLISHKFA